MTPGSSTVPFRSVRSRPVRRVRDGTASAIDDALAVEEPLEVHVQHGPAEARTVTSLGLTMRTPGHDRELVAGLLWAEGLLASAGDLIDVRPGPDPDGVPQPNEAVADLRPGAPFEPEAARKAYTTSSACGVCGRANLDALERRPLAPLDADAPRVPDPVLRSLPQRLRQAQLVFEATGGLHAAALFDAHGALHALREDVGRHNAVDKLVGASLFERRLPLSDRVLLVSGRAGYEILQKARAAGVPFVAAIGAPSTLAVELAERFDVTLVGFLHASGYNVYAGPQRIASTPRVRPV